MNNADTPIVPIATSTYTDINGITYLDVESKGITKREHFAGLAMQGLLSSVRLDELVNYNLLISNSVRMADALLKELEK